MKSFSFKELNLILNGFSIHLLHVELGFQFEILVVQRGDFNIFVVILFLEKDYVFILTFFGCLKLIFKLLLDHFNFFESFSHFSAFLCHISQLGIFFFKFLVELINKLGDLLHISTWFSSYITLGEHFFGSCLVLFDLFVLFLYLHLEFFDLYLMLSL